jgi:hypothetical protein
MPFNICLVGKMGDIDYQLASVRQIVLGREDRA